MLTSALIEYRRRAYADAIAPLELAQIEIAEVLAEDQGLVRAMRADRANAGQAATSEQDALRADAQTLAGFAVELEHVMTETYEEDFPDLPFANGDGVDLDTSVNEGAETFRYYVFSGMSVARFSSAYSAGTSPGTSISAGVVHGRIEGMENHYEMTFKDLRNAAFAGVPLETMLGSAARRAHDELLHKTLLWGREDLGLPGFATHPNITITRAPATGSGSSRAWADKSNDQILLDVATLVDTPGAVSLGMRETTDVAWPRATERLLRARRMGTGDGTLTLLQFIRTNYPEVTFRRLDDLAASRSFGNLATDSAIAYVRNRQVLRGIVPMPFRQHPPERRDLKMRVMCESSTGGMVIKEPMTIHRLDDIGAS